MTMDYLQILKQVMIDHAKREQLFLDSNPHKLLATHLHTTSFIGKLTGDLAPQWILPSSSREMDAVLIGSCSVLMANLKDSSKHSVSIRDYYTQAAMVRGFLGGKDGDLYLLLIGPCGSRYDDEWRRVAQSIERDESICRKLVWLPSQESGEEAIRREAELFCDRTFLARPWLSGMEDVQHDLDAINAIYEKLRKDFTAQTNLSANVLNRWLRILEQPEEIPQVAHSLFLSAKGEK